MELEEKVKDEQILTSDVLKKLDEVGEQIQYSQEINDRLLKQYDGLDLDSVKKNAEQAASNYENLQKKMQKMKADEMAERLKAVELELAKGHPAEDDKRLEKNYTDEMLRYIRKGIRMNESLSEDVCAKNANFSLYGQDDLKLQLVTKDLLTSVGPEAGYLILPDRSNEIIKRIFETSPIRSLANVVSTASNEFEIPIDDEEFEFEWVEEAESRNVTATSQIGLIKIPVTEMAATPQATQKMLDDAGFDIEGWIMTKTASIFSRGENLSFVKGNGASQPKGFTEYPGWTAPGEYTRHAVEQRVTTGTTGLLDNADDLRELQTDLLEAYQASSVWGMHRKTFAAASVIRETTGADPAGAYLISPTMLRDGVQEVLLGNRVVFMSDMDKPGSSGKAIVVYADFSQFYTIVDRFAIRLMRNPYKNPPFVQFYTTRRVGGAVTNYQAGKLLVTN